MALQVSQIKKNKSIRDQRLERGGRALLDIRFENRYLDLRFCDPALDLFVCSGKQGYFNRGPETAGLQCK